MFINLTPIHHEDWSELKINCAKQFGEVFSYDLEIDPKWDEHDAKAYIENNVLNMVRVLAETTESNKLGNVVLINNTNTAPIKYLIDKLCNDNYGAIPVYEVKVKRKNQSPGFFSFRPYRRTKKANNSPG